MPIYISQIILRQRPPNVNDQEDDEQESTEQNGGRLCPADEGRKFLHVEIISNLGRACLLTVVIMEAVLGDGDYFRLEVK